MLGPEGERPPADESVTLFLITDSLQGGLGLAVLAQADYFRRRNWRVAVAAPDQPAAVDVPEIIHLPVPTTAFQLVGILRTARTLRSLLRTRNPRVVHAHGLRSHLLVLLAGRRPYVSVHGGGRMSGQSGVSVAFRAACRRFAPLLARRAFSVAPMPGAWTLTLVASPRLQELKQTPFSAVAKIPTFLWIGRLDAPKLPHLFVQAVSKAAGISPVRGVMIGDGPHFAEVAALVEELAAPIELRGASEDIATALEAAWALCLFSESEGLPFVVQEAAWAARPLLVTPLPRLRWFLGEEAEYAATVDEAAAAMLRLTRRSYAEDLGVRAAARVRTQLKPDSPGPDLERAFAEDVGAQRQVSGSPSGQDAPD